MAEKMKEKTGDMTISEIIDISNGVTDAAEAFGIKICLIGGGLFKFIGIPGYETPDLDFAADKDMPDGVFKNVDNPNAFSWNSNGHYLVRGRKVDFIHKLADGTSKLYLNTIRRAYKHTGLNLARVQDACAIRLAACRKKDLKTLKMLSKAGAIDIVEVANIIVAEAPKSPGGKLAREIIKAGGWPKQDVIDGLSPKLGKPKTAPRGVIIGTRRKRMAGK